MIEEIKAHYEKDGAMAVLDRLKRLRRYDGDESSFWLNYLALVALLCRSPVAFLVLSTGNDWSLGDIKYDETGGTLDITGIYSSFAGLMPRAIKSGFAYERSPLSVPGKASPFLLALHLDSYDGEFVSGICIIVDKSNAQLFSDVVLRAGLISDIPRDYYSNSRTVSQEVSASQKLAVSPDREMDAIVDLAHSVMTQSRFITACSTVVNEISHKFNCSRVTIGWQKRGYVRLVAVSHLEEFKSDSPAPKQLEMLFEEVVDQDTGIIIPAELPHFVVDRAHRDFVTANVLNQVISLPVYLNETTVGVITCELMQEKLSLHQIELIAHLLEIVSPWLGALHYQDKWFGARLLHKFKNMGSSWMTAERLALKVSLSAAVMLVLLTLIVRLDYRVEGVASLQTDLVRYVSAPFDGVVQDVFVREGEKVKVGERLLALDTKELRLKQTQESADIVRFVQEADKSRAQNALADMKIAQSRVDELSAEIKRTNYNLERATMTAPGEGIVVEGDTKKLLGAPVAKGDVLMKIARVEKMYAQIKIRERDIDEIKNGMSGDLVLISQPENIFSYRVEKMIPLAEIDQHEGNVFVIKAIFNDQSKSWWKPGMSGVARIDVGKRTIAWILTHRIVDFIRMYIWW